VHRRQGKGSVKSGSADAEAVRPARASNVPEFDVLCISGIIQNCSWNQPNRGAQLAEKSVDQTREAYEHSKNALEAAVDTMARSFDALGQGASALNRKIVEIAQENVSSGFDLAKSLATARTLAEMVELRATYWRKQFSALAAQAEEVRALSTKVAADMAAPIKAHVTRSIEQLAGANIAVNAEPDGDVPSIVELGGTSVAG
jgi:phasin